MRRNVWWRAGPWVLASALLWVPAAGVQAAPGHAHGLPALGDGGEMTLSDERRLGDQIVRQLYRDPSYFDDPVLQVYLQSIWEPLVASARRRGDMSAELAERFAWDILIGRDRMVNAFALPGGYLGVYLGLIATVSTPDELASVLAHELSHVSQRHIARLIGRQNQQTPWVIGAMILGALAASSAKNVDIASAAMAGGQAVAIQSQLNFSRDMEREADRVGFGIMTDAGFDGAGFVTLFDKLQTASRLNDDGAFPYLRSHPLTAERMADMSARMPERASGNPSGQPGPISAEWHAMMAARARVWSETSAEALQHLAAPLRHSNGPKADAATLGIRYAATLAAARLRDASAVHDGLRQLQASLPTDARARHAVAWLALETGVLLGTTGLDAGRREALGQLALERLRGAQRPDVVLAAQMALLLDAEVQRVAVQRLQAWTSLHPRDALAWQTLSSLHMAQQQPVRAARADGEARMAHLDAQGAAERFRAAQQMARQSAETDHIELSIVDARLRQAEALWREQLRESR